MRLQKHISGEMVLGALADHPHGIPNRVAMADLMGLSIGEVGVGLTWVRDVAASDRGTPCTWTRANG